MNTPIPPGSPYIPPFSPSEVGQSSGASGTAAAAGGGGKGIQNLDVRKFYDEVMKIANQFSQTAPVGGGNPLVDKLGAPRIDAPNQNFSVNDLTDLLRSMRSKSQDGQLRAAKEGIEAAKLKAEANNNAQLEKVKEWVDKCKEAESKGLLGKIFGWVGKIFAALAAAVLVVVAAVATVATGGAAAPLLAIAVIGAVSATMSLASAISQEAGGPAISIDSLIQHTVGKFLTDVCGVDPKVAENISRIVGGVVGIASLAVVIEPSLVGNMVQGIAILSGADEQTAGYIGMAVTIAATIAVGIAMAVATCGTSAAGTAVDVSAKVVVETMKAVN
ncbi:MAG: type III secretion system translocon subunit SctE, partial [Burkholderiaceae bacterium]|nr:type III secretion system translocon subunit SctE [Burkholderiaceae bacterium]